MDNSSQTPPAAARLLTIREAADHLTVSERTMRRILARGDVPTVRMGRVVRLRPADLEALIAATTATP